MVALCLSALAASSCLYQASAAARHVSDVAPTPTPIASTTRATQVVDLPRAVLLRVPFTSQAPLGDWAQRQHTCEEASLLMVDRYLKGDHSGRLIDPMTAERAINQITLWKPAVDLTPQQVGQVAEQHMGWAYAILPADRMVMDEQLALGRPLIVGVRTHGLGNPSYPGYFTHHEQPGWSVSHYLVVVGYDLSGNFILNDPGITLGHGTRITFAQLIHAIDDLDHAYPNLNAGRVFLVLTP
jgi:hypothetical protein